MFCDPGTPPQVAVEADGLLLEHAHENLQKALLQLSERAEPRLAHKVEKTSERCA